MNKRYAGVIIYVAVVSSIVVLNISFSIAPRDVSWIGEVENWIKEENWKPDVELGLGDNFFLYENGESQFFVLYSQNEFKTYIRGLMNRISGQVRGSISEESMAQIKAVNKVLVLYHRFPTMNPQWRSAPMLGWYRNYDAVYFVLEDRLETGLEGTIIIREPYMEEPYFRYSVWQITDYVLW